MDNNSRNNGSDLSPDLGLEFEIGGSDGLVFEDPSPSQGAIVEIDLGSSGVEFAREDDSISLPRSFVAEEKYSSDSFIDDPSRPAPTYIPRFTDASERYRMSGTVGSRRNVPEATRASIDPTSEVDEERETPHVVVSAAPIKAEEPAEDSIMILKFDDDDNASQSVDDDEREASYLTEVVMEAAHPRIEETAEAVAEECDTEQVALEEEES